MLAHLHLYADAVTPSEEPVKIVDGRLMCVDCNIAMRHLMDGIYDCPTCSQEYISSVSVNVTKSGDTCVRDSKGRMRRTRTKTQDYRKQQIAHNRAVMMTRNDDYRRETGYRGIPDDVINEVSYTYSDLQVMYYNLLGTRFVRRGKIKDQILACLVYKLMKKKGMPMQRAEVAKIFVLDESGFSTGETQVQELEESLELDLVSNIIDETVDLSIKYIRAIDRAIIADNIVYDGEVTTVDNIQFVVNLVMRAEVIKAGICCYLYSRVSGAISILLTELSLKIRNKLVEEACDSCKKNTFDRFRKIVQNNAVYFDDIFDALADGDGTLDGIKKLAGDVYIPGRRGVNISRLWHTRRYMQILVDVWGKYIPEFINLRDMSLREDIPDDWDPYVDGIFREYGYPASPDILKDMLKK
jgi:hypothetical protein